MESSNQSLDEQCIKFLELLADLEVKKQELENHMKNGFFHLAKARYAIGVNRVSQLSYPSTMVSSVGVDFSKADEKKFALCKPKLNEASDSEEKNVETLLRKRHTNKDSDSDDKSDLKDEAVEEIIKPTIKVTDPIRWFSALAPQSLRSAQSSFSQAIRETCDICNLQAQIEEVRKLYQTKRNQKS